MILGSGSYLIANTVFKPKPPKPVAESLKPKEDIRIISAWKYPGITKPGEPLPKAILREFKEVI